MKVLVTGARGQLGFDVLKELQKRNIEHLGVDRTEFDITDEVITRNFIEKYRPTVVIHCAAYTAVDKAEEEVELCQKINVQGTENIAKACKEIDAVLMYISTDYVFSGTGTDNYATEDATAPVNAYGASKLAGELVVGQHCNKHFIVRISWVFGENGANFVSTMLRLGKERQELNVVSDQVGSPTYTPDLAKLLIEMSATDKYGVYHATNEGTCSWAEFAEEIFKQAGLATKVNYISSSEYPTKAARPYNSRLSKEKLTQNGFTRLPTWQNALLRFLHK